MNWRDKILKKISEAGLGFANIVYVACKKKNGEIVIKKAKKKKSGCLKIENFKSEKDFKINKK
ncbi:MAG: hypothetical protein ABIN00_08205 [candidate division WOR-3 bacterium]